MTTLNLPLDVYDVTLGIDLTLGTNADLSLDDLDGDLATVSGAQMVTESVRRRITTTPEGYSRLVKASDNYLIPIGGGYGSRLPYHLSSPMTSVGLTDTVANEVSDVATQDVRVADARSYITEVNNAKARLGVGLDYRLQDVEDLSKGNVGVGSFTVAGLTSGTVNRNYQLVIPVEG